MPGEYVIMVAGELITYTDYDDIPNTFEHVIKFIPDYPEGDPVTGHTQEEHELMETFTDKLQELMERERLCQQFVE